MPARAALLAGLCATLLLAACGKEAPDAYGNFEAAEVVGAAETSGRLLRFDVREGETLAAGATVGLVDTTALSLQRQEIDAQRIATRTREVEAGAQVEVLRAQLATARVELARTRRLYRAEAATAQALNRAEGEVRVLEARIEAAAAQTVAVSEEAGGADARLAQIDERVSRSRLVNPTAGTVLTAYAEPGEFVQVGQPLYRIADLRTLTLRAYVSGDQLARVRIGQRVTVQVDAGRDSLVSVQGVTRWVATQAEFTPTPIQTRDERADQVYAVKIEVPNPGGMLKIGMPGEVLFPGAGAPRRAAR
ncbi:MAG TPA: HlyD family efflux transporter periplasmic adaptor subunit [Longimicrobium sp.]|nr:HlyD family efflux transporter periplasmic adaptor subunit [Longimicrobium sp.]